MTKIILHPLLNYFHHDLKFDSGISAILALKADLDGYNFVIRFINKSCYWGNHIITKPILALT